MSASPAPPTGPASTTPSGTAPAGSVMRKRPQSNPFMKKKPVKKPSEASKAPLNTPSNGTGARGKTEATQPAKSVPAKPDPDDDPSTYATYPLVSTKKELLAGLRFHAMRLVSEQDVNPYDTAQFTRPLRLHRRFQRDQKQVPIEPENGIDDKEREREEIRKAERQAQKEANQAQIAPTEKPSQVKRRQQFKKKVEDVFYPQDTPEAQKRAKLRYEEGRPWHLEDFDAKNTWVGTYEEPLSETQAMLVLDGNGSFRMVPLEKWYRFAPTGRYKTMNLDEAEKHMAKKVSNSRWFIENTMTDEQRHKLDLERQRRMQRGRVGMRGERRRGADDDRPEMADDANEIDYNAEDEFQDDDEGKLFGGDENDIKESEKRIRQEMLGANIFAGTGLKEEKDWDAEEAKEKKEASDERKRQRRLRRALVKNERKYEYESESDHPYSEDTEESDNDLELKVDGEDGKPDDKPKLGGEKTASAPSSVGTGTPSTRPEKHGDASRSTALHSLKRPGSPNLSEASGTESTRKRIKKEANGAVSRPMSPSRPDGQRPMSPVSALGRNRGAGSDSDTEASGNEGRRARIRLANRGSRDASPGMMSAPPSRPHSPTPLQRGTAAPSTTSGTGLPSASEIRAAIPPAGITITELIGRFRGQVGSTVESKQAFIALVKSVGRNSAHDRKLIVQK